MIVAENLQKILDYSFSTLERDLVPGAAIGIIEKEKVLYAGGWGTTNLETKQPITKETRFPIASISKSFTATAFMLLMEKRLLDLEKPVKTYLPNFTFYDEWTTKEANAPDLITHRAGLFKGCLEDLRAWKYTAEDMKNALRYAQPSTSFRTSYAYNNIPYLWAEDLIEKLSGLPYKDFIYQEILSPLNMCNTYVGRAGLKHQQAITGYVLDEVTHTNPMPIDYSRMQETLLSAGGLVSTIEDLLTWLQVHLQQRSFLRQMSLQKMQTPFVNIMPYVSYGLGWRINDERKYRYFSHGGLIPGIRHNFLFIPKLETGIVVLTTLTDAMTSHKITNFFCETLLGKAQENVRQSVEIKASKPTLNDLLKTSSRPFDLTSCQYTNPILGPLTLNANAQTLTLEKTGACAKITPIQNKLYSLYFLDEAGQAFQKGYWGYLSFDEKKLKMNSIHSSQVFELHVSC